MKRVAVFASGNGSNFEALVRRAKGYKVVLLFFDRQDAFVKERAAKLGIPARYASIVREKDNYENVILEYLDEFNIDLVVLAGYMKIIGPKLLNVWGGRIINIHPSLLPKYPGVNAIERAWRAKEEKIGITIHYVDGGMDTGEIITQQEVPLDPEWSLNETEIYVHGLEHKYYPEVVSKLLSGGK